jgi:phage tail sheath gpL-like
MVFAAGDNPSLADNSILNAASLAIFQEGVIALGGSIHAGDVVSITVNNTLSSAGSKDYTYTVQDKDTLGTVAKALADAINANGGDPAVVALSSTTGQVLLTSRASQLPNNSISMSAPPARAHRSPRHRRAVT